jgi:hypothetical protein
MIAIREISRRSSEPIERLGDHVLAFEVEMVQQEQR